MINWPLLKRMTAHDAARLDVGRQNAFPTLVAARRRRRGHRLPHPRPNAQKEADRTLYWMRVLADKPAPVRAALAPRPVAAAEAPWAGTGGADVAAGRARPLRDVEPAPAVRPIAD
jgi:hypothetical protein